MIVKCPRSNLEGKSAPYLDYCEDGEFTVSILHDSYGDANVIGGIAYCVDFEMEEQSCECELTPEEEEQLYETARKQYEDGPPDYGIDEPILPSMDVYDGNGGVIGL